MLRRASCHASGTKLIINNISDPFELCYGAFNYLKIPCSFMEINKWIIERHASY